MEKIEFYGWKNCVRIANQEIELIATTDVGPRLIHLGYLNQPNMFKTLPDQLGKTNQENWMLFGGHRLWHTPESKPRTYYPDNQAIDYIEKDNGLELRQSTEPTTGIKKTMAVSLDPDQPFIKIIHTLTNKGLWPVETSAWALSVMAPGGLAIIPLPERGSHPKDLLPTAQLTLWPYTRLNDPRWNFGAENIFLKQDVTTNQPQKVGVHSPDAWLAYLNEGFLFIKLTFFNSDAQYADMGSNLEVFTDHRILELETLSGIKKIEPGQSINHTEFWAIHQQIPLINNDQDVANVIKPLVRDLLYYAHKNSE